MEQSTGTQKSTSEKISVFIAITTLVLAVCATMAAFNAAGYGNKMVLTQSQASDQWAYYQAKSIKETVYQLQADIVKQTADQSGSSAALEKKLEEYNGEIRRYGQEKESIAAEAKRLEQERDTAQQFNSDFGRALIFLQIGILLSSLASINKVHYYWYAGLLTGAAGVFVFLTTWVKTFH